MVVAVEAATLATIAVQVWEMASLGQGFYHVIITVRMLDGWKKMGTM